jgi:hypothetical protein
METPYALIIDGKALLYALSPRLRQLFLEVRQRAAATIATCTRIACKLAAQPSLCFVLHMTALFCTCCCRAYLYVSSDPARV